MGEVKWRKGEDGHKQAFVGFDPNIDLWIRIQQEQREGKVIKKKDHKVKK